MRPDVLLSQKVIPITLKNLNGQPTIYIFWHFMKLKAVYLIFCQIINLSSHWKYSALVNIRTCSHIYAIFSGSLLNCF